jgi:hypothetical protein
MLLLGGALGLRWRRRIRVEEALGDALGRELAGTDPRAKEPAPAVLVLAEALDLAIGVAVVEGKARVGVAVLGRVVCDDANGERRGFCILLERGLRKAGGGKRTGELVHLAAEEDLGLDGLVLDEVVVEVLVDDGVAGISCVLRGRLRGGLRWRVASSRGAVAEVLYILRDSTWRMMMRRRSLRKVRLIVWP